MMQKADAIVNGEFELQLVLVFIVLEENEASFSKQPIKQVSMTKPDNFDPSTALEFGSTKGFRQTSV